MPWSNIPEEHDRLASLIVKVAKTEESKARYKLALGHLAHEMANSDKQTSPATYASTMAMHALYPEILQDGIHRSR